jgi:hypothetical protein
VLGDDDTVRRRDQKRQAIEDELNARVRSDQVKLGLAPSLHSATGTDLLAVAPAARVLSPADPRPGWCCQPITERVPSSLRKDRGMTGNRICHGS